MKCTYFYYDDHCYSNFMNTLRPRQICGHFTDDIFKCIFLNENVWFCLRFHWNLFLRFEWKNTPALVQIMAWRWPGDKPVSEPMMDGLLTHICGTRLQWVNCLNPQGPIHNLSPLVWVMSFHQTGYGYGQFYLYSSGMLSVSCLLMLMLFDLQCTDYK